MIGVIFGGIAIILTWTLMSETSPFYQDMSDSSTIRQVWQILNFVPFLVLVMARSLPLGILLLFIQWFLIGIFVDWVFTRIRINHGE